MFPSRLASRIYYDDEGETKFQVDATNQQTLTTWGRAESILQNTRNSFPCIS